MTLQILRIPEGLSTFKYSMTLFDTNILVTPFGHGEYLALIGGPETHC